MPKAKIDNEQLVKQGAEIQRSRMLGGLSRKALADRVGVSVAAVALWERGITDVSPGNRAALRNALKMDPGDLPPVQAELATDIPPEPAIDFRMIGIDRARLMLDAELPYDLVMEIIQKVRQSLQADARTEGS